MFRCTESFVTADRRRVGLGDVVADDDPVLDGRESLFAPVEQATAEPGERRSTRRPKKAATTE